MVPRKFSETQILVGKKCTNLQCSKNRKPYSLSDFGGDHKDFKATQFCPQCGRSTEDVTKPNRKSIIDETELQLAMDERLVHLSNPNDTSGEHAFHPTMDIWIPNIHYKLKREKIDVDVGGLQVISAQTINDEKDRFSLFFMPELKKLKEVYGDVTVEWAVLAYVR